jgi:DNA end-binding protein Ku
LPDHEEQELLRRAFWSGTITFGLVSIPVALFSGNRNARVSLRMLSPDGTPLRRQFFCPKEDRPVERNEIVRGYEYTKDQYIMVTDDELEALEPEKSREIDLRRFVPVDQIDPMYFDRAYFFAPTGDSKKPYRLLAEVMEKTRRAGIATFVMRSKEYLVAILSENGILRAETLRFAEELRTPADVGLPEPVAAPASTVRVIDKEIRAATAEKLDVDELTDKDSERLAALIEKKKAAGEGVIHPEITPEDEDEEQDGGKVIDIMEVLKRSLKRTGASEAKSKKDDSSPEPMSARELQRKSKKELYEKAQELDIPGRSAMDREDLIKAIRQAGEG